MVSGLSRVKRGRSDEYVQEQRITGLTGPTLNILPLLHVSLLFFTCVSDELPPSQDHGEFSYKGQSALILVLQGSFQKLRDSPVHYDLVGQLDNAVALIRETEILHIPTLLPNRGHQLICFGDRVPRVVRAV